MPDILLSLVIPLLPGRLVFLDFHQDFIVLIPRFADAVHLLNLRLELCRAVLDVIRHKTADVFQDEEWEGLQRGFQCGVEGGVYLLNIRRVGKEAGPQGIKATVRVLVAGLGRPDIPIGVRQCLREVPAAYIENGLQLVTGAAVDIVGLRGQHKQVGKRTQRVLPQLFHDRQSENVAFQEGDILNPHEAGRLGEVDDDIGGLRRRKGDDIIVLRLRPKAGEVDDAAVLQDWSVQKEHRGACLLLVVLALPRPERVEHLYPAGRQLRPAGGRHPRPAPNPSPRGTPKRPPQ